MIALLVLLVGCTDDGADGERSYLFDEVRIDADLQPDGSLSVVEERTFDFSGTYRFAFYELPLADGQDIVDLAVAEEGTPLVEGDPDEEAPGTFGLDDSDDDDALAFTWYYRSPATDEQRTFTISYTVTAAAVRHADSAELYWQWVGDGWEVPTRALVADVDLPGEAPLVVGDDLSIWAHGPLDGTVEQVGPRTIRTSVADVPAATFVELRALFPAEDLADAPDDGRTVRAAIVAEEDCLAVGADADRARARGQEPAADCDPDAGRRSVVSVVLVVLAAATALGAGLLYATRGRRAPLPPDLPDLEWTPPTRDPPALVEWLLRRGTLGEGALTATLLDMARRGVLTLEETPGPDGRPDVAFRLGDESAPRYPFEEPVVELLLPLAGDGRAVTRDELTEWVSAHKTEAGAAWSAFASAVAAEGKSRHWQRPTWPFGVVVAIGLLVLLASGIGAALGAVPAALVVGFATAVVVLACSPLLLRRTAEGRTLATRWERYGEFLRGTGDGAASGGGAGGTSLPPLDDALVYAVPLGVAPVLARRLKLTAARADTTGLPFPVWYGAVWAHGRDRDGGFGGGGGGFGGLDSVASAVQSAGASSSSGGGGGFSGGGGGGGGGSGGGAG